MKDTCEEIRSLIDRFQDGELPEEGVYRLERHLLSCPDCRKELEAEQDLRTRFSLLPELECPERVLRRIEEAIADPRSRRPAVTTWGRPAGLRRLRWLPLAAAAAAAVLLITLNPFSDREEPVATRYSMNEIVQARQQAGWTLAYVAKTMCRSERSAAREALVEHLPAALTTGFRHTPLPGGDL